MLLCHLKHLPRSARFIGLWALTLLMENIERCGTPDFARRLPSCEVRFLGCVDEKVVPKEAHGIIDYRSYMITKAREATGTIGIKTSLSTNLGSERRRQLK